MASTLALHDFDEEQNQIDQRCDRQSDPLHHQIKQDAIGLAQPLTAGKKLRFLLNGHSI